MGFVVDWLKIPVDEVVLVGVDVWPKIPVGAVLLLVEVWPKIPVEEVVDASGFELIIESPPKSVVFVVEIGVSEVCFSVLSFLMEVPPKIELVFAASPPNIPLLVVVVIWLVFPNRFLEAVEFPPKIDVELTVEVDPNIDVVVVSLNENMELAVVAVKAELPKIPTDDFGIVCESFVKCDIFSFVSLFLPKSLSCSDWLVTCEPVNRPDFV